MIDEFDLTPAQLDAMREIGNIGAGNSYERTQSLNYPD